LSSQNIILIFGFILWQTACGEKTRQSTNTHQEADSSITFTDSEKDILSMSITGDNPTDTSLAAPSITERIELIRQNFKRINEINQWDTINRNLWESTEGGNVIYYYHQSTLEKIITRHLGETFQSVTEYYLLHHKLSFIFDRMERYNRPIYWDSTQMLSFDDDQVFDRDKSTFSETRTYFDNDTIFRQLYTEQNHVADETTDWHQETLKLIDRFNKLLQLAEKQ